MDVVQVLGDGPSREDAGLAVARKVILHCHVPGYATAGRAVQTGNFFRKCILEGCELNVRPALVNFISVMHARLQVFMRVLETAGSKAASGAYAASLAAIAGSTTPRLPAELTAVYVRMEDDRKYQRTVGELQLRMTVGNAGKLGLPTIAVSMQAGGMTSPPGFLRDKHRSLQFNFIMTAICPYLLQLMLPCFGAFAVMPLLLTYCQSLNARMRLAIVTENRLMGCCHARAPCVLSRSYAAGEYLVRERLLLLPEVDAHFAAAITTNQAGGATELAVHLLKAAAQDPQPPLTGLDLSATSEACLASTYHPALQQVLSDSRWACVVPSCSCLELWYY